MSQASEFHEIRFRTGEKAAYKILNDNPLMKYRIPVNVDMPQHKISILIQSVLGGIDFPDDEKTKKHRSQFTTDAALVFQHVHRLIRCIIDCQLQLEDSVAARNALTLARSLGARVWDDSPLHMKQIEGVGPVTVRKLVNANIRTIEELEVVESQRIESMLSRNPPFGAKLLDQCKAFPKLRISLSAAANPVCRTHN